MVEPSPVAQPPASSARTDPAQRCDAANRPVRHLGVPDALLVVGDTSAPEGDNSAERPSHQEGDDFVERRLHQESDNSVERRLRQEGFEVERRKASEVTAIDAEGRALVVIAETAGTAGSVFRTAAVPVVALAARAFADLGLTGGQEGVDYGFTAPQKKVVIVTAAHQLAAGLMGNVVVARQPIVFAFGRALPSATVVASALHGGQDVVFGYERNASLAGLRAPARRVGFFSGLDGNPGALNESGHSLFAAAIHWAATRRAIFVVGAFPPAGGDQAGAARLASLGFHVEFLLDRAALPPATRAGDLVLVSSSASAQRVGDKLRHLKVPVVVAQPEIYDDMAMTAHDKGASQGALDVETVLDVVDTGHPLAAGLRGPVAVVLQAAPFSWGVPAATGVTIATAQGRPVIFAYEEGARMEGRSAAPARRIGWFASEQAMSRFTQGGWALFDAAVLWASGHDVVSYLTCVLGEAPDAVPAPDSVGTNEILVPILSGASLTVGRAGADVVAFATPRALEIPYELRMSVGPEVGRAELTFSGSACVRPAGFDADAWSALSGNDVVCTYLARANREAGYPFLLQACSGGIGAYDQIVAGGVRLAMSPSPVGGTVAEVSVPGAGGGVLEEPVSATETANLRDAFSWTTTQEVSETDEQGRPALWYAMVYVQGSAERDSLTQLPMGHSYLPLFASELARWHGLRGFFLHEGDGRGVFAFTVLPGRIYNLLREQALAGTPVFTVVHLRDVPAEARTAVGSISYAALPPSVSTGGAQRTVAARPRDHRAGRTMPGPIKRAAQEIAAQLSSPALGAAGSGGPKLTVVTAERQLHLPTDDNYISPSLTA